MKDSSFNSPIINGKLSKVTSHLFTLNYLPKYVKDGMIQCNLCKKEGITKMLPYTVTSSAKKMRNGSTKEAVHHIAQCHPEAYKVYLQTKTSKKSSVKLSPVFSDFSTGLSIGILIDLIFSENNLKILENSYKKIFYQKLGFSVKIENNQISRALRYHAARSRSFILTHLKNLRVNIFLGEIFLEENFRFFYFLLLKNDFVYFLNFVKIEKNEKTFEKLLDVTQKIINELVSWKLFIIAIFTENSDICKKISETLNLPHFTPFSYFLDEIVQIQISEKQLKKIEEKIIFQQKNSENELSMLEEKVNFMLENTSELEKDEKIFLERSTKILLEIRENYPKNSKNLLNFWKFSSKIIFSKNLDLNFKLTFNTILESGPNKSHLLDIFIFLTPSEPSEKAMKDFKLEHSRFFTAEFLSDPISKLMKNFNLNFNEKILKLYENKIIPFNIPVQKSEQIGEEITYSKDFWMKISALLPAVRPLAILYEILCEINANFSPKNHIFNFIKKFYEKRKFDSSINEINDMIFIRSLIDDSVLNDMNKAMVNEEDFDERTHPLYALESR